MYLLGGLIYFFEINNHFNVTVQIYHFHLSFNPYCQLDQIYFIMITYYLYFVKIFNSNNNFQILCSFNHYHKNQILLILQHYYFSSFMTCFNCAFKKYFFKNISLKIIKSFYHFIFLVNHLSSRMGIRILVNNHKFHSRCFKSKINFFYYKFSFLL